MGKARINSLKLDEMLRNEILQKQDIVIGDFIDSYQNLTKVAFSNLLEFDLFRLAYFQKKKLPGNFGNFGNNRYL